MDENTTLSFQAQGNDCARVLGRYPAELRAIYDYLVEQNVSAQLADANNIVFDSASGFDLVLAHYRETSRAGDAQLGEPAAAGVGQCAVSARPAGGEGQLEGGALMGISGRTRKILWGRSGSLGAYCRRGSRRNRLVKGLEEADRPG